MFKQENKVKFCLIYMEGYNAPQHTACPFYAGRERNVWLAGYHDGRRART